MKRGPLSKVEAHYINSKTELTDEEIASELDRSVELVRENRIVQYKKAQSPFMKMVKGKNNGVVVSSEGASQIGDDARENTYSTRGYNKNVGKVFPD